MLKEDQNAQFHNEHFRHLGPLLDFMNSVTLLLYSKLLECKHVDDF
jgi:hypothetical protein